MHCRRFLFLVLTFLAISRLASAQEVLTVDKLTLNQHVNHRVTPVYPPIAKAARIQGTVVFDVRIGVTGKIESMKVISGPAMLQQAAMDSLKQWTYHPFEKDGKPVPASGTVSIEFSLGKDGPTPKEEEIASRYFPLSDQCRKAVSTKADYSVAALVCKQAADVANEFPIDRRFIEKRSAFVYAAYALMNNNDLSNALAYAKNAVDVVKLGHDDNSGSDAAYGIKGKIESILGDFDAADQDLTIAEDYERKAIAWAEKEKFEHEDEYKQALVWDLRFHARVLQVLNRSEEAQKKLDEAAKYN
jgi:TonB family protein